MIAPCAGSEPTVRRRERPRRGIYLLPTSLTVANLCCGFAAAVQAAQGRFELAALLVVVAGGLDLLDGRIARLTRTSSEFGLQFDSLADIVSFGVAPALLVYHWGLAPLERMGWAVSFLFVVCAATRLARFNLQPGSADKRYFVGLPSPPAAVALAALVYAMPEPAERAWPAGALAAGVAAVALLMVSRFRYRSFKDVDLHDRRSYLYVLPLAGALAAILAEPRVALPLLAGGYVLSGPGAYFWALRQRHRRVLAPPGEVLDEPSLR